MAREDSILGDRLSDVITRISLGSLLQQSDVVQRFRKSSGRTHPVTLSITHKCGCDFGTEFDVGQAR